MVIKKLAASSGVIWVVVARVAGTLDRVSSKKPKLSTVSVPLPVVGEEGFSKSLIAQDATRKTVLSMVNSFFIGVHHYHHPPYHP